jgi:hypothetical protein
MRKLAMATASAMLGMALSFSSVVPAVYASSKVDCDAVMQAVGQGKTSKEVATDMKISTSSVNRCKKHAKEAAKAETKSQNMSDRSSAAGAPAGAPSTTP